MVSNIYIIIYSFYERLRSYLIIWYLIKTFKFYFFYNKIKLVVKENEKISLLFVTFIGLVSVGLLKNTTNFDEENVKIRKQISFDNDKNEMIKSSAL